MYNHLYLIPFKTLTAFLQSILVTVMTAKSTKSEHLLYFFTSISPGHLIG
jgi:hypothetical protein